jgi:hypothetical protein
MSGVPYSEGRRSATIPDMKTLVGLLVVIAACAGSSAELKTAHEARYRGEPAVLLTAMRSVTAATYNVVAVDESTLAVKTEPKWYNPEGQADQTGGNNLARLREDSINFSVVVKLVPADGTFTVNVEPTVLRLHGLSSKLENMSMSDPLTPGWVHGKVESLEVALYQKLKAYLAAGGASAAAPAVAPAPPTPASATPPDPAPAPAPAPTEPSPTPAP